MNTILNAIAGYFFLLLTVRVLARRPGGQLTMFEFVLVFLMGGVIIAATAANDRSMTNCMSAVIVVGMMHRLIAMAKTRFPKVGAVVDGTPVVLRHRGEWNQEALDATKISSDDVLAAARGNGIARVEDVEYAVLERSGEISTMEAE